MHFTTLIAATCATLATALPAAQFPDPAFSLRCLDKPNLDCNAPDIAIDPTIPGTFNITNFIFGCSSGCYWNLNVSVEGEYQNHPAVTTPVYLNGGLDENKDYVVASVSATQDIAAYIVKETNELKLRYTARYPKYTAVYNYYGNTTVYTATSDKAALQQPNFKVAENYATGVA